jgi:tape measure domain-containing protein
MATSSNKRDVRLGVEIETAGEESLKRLAAEVRALAKAGDEAAPQYEQLAQSIERNVAVARELAVFKQASEAIASTSTAAQKATENAQRLREEFQRQSEATEALKTTQAGIRTQLDATNRAVNEQTRILAQNKAALKASKDDTGELAKAAASAASSLAKFKEESANLSLDLKKANAEVKTAESTLRKLAEESLNADQASRTLAAALRTQADAMERAQRAAAELDADFTDVAAAQERLDRALRDGQGMLEAAAAAEKLAREERAAAAAVTALTDDLDRQADVVRGKLVASMAALSEAHEKEQAAVRESLALAAREEAAAQRKAALATRLAQLQAEETASLRGETAERERAQAAAQGELETIRESVRFLETYADRKAKATQESLEFVLALDREEQAAKDAAAAAQKLNDEFERTSRNRQYVVDLAAALDAAEKQAAEAAAQVQKLQGYFEKIGQQRNVIDGAFGTTGVRSIQAIEQEMFKLQRALVTLKGEFSDGRISLADFERATGSAQVRLAALKREIETIPGDRTVFQQLAEGADNLVNSYGRLTVVFATVGAALTPLIREFVALESTTRILTQVTGSAEEAGKQIEFLRNVAQKSGTAFGEVSSSYAKFAASALQAGLSTQTVQKTFESVALAAGNLGLNSDQAKRALEALGQIASKGTVSMEELRQQLGDALPGVLPLLAQQLGLTNAELNKLVEAGELSAESVIPALAEALTKLGPKTGVVEGLVASFNRFKNIMFEAGTTLIEGPLGQAAGGVLTVLASVIRDIGVVAVGASEAINLLGRTLGLVFAALSGGIKNFSEFKAELNALLEDSSTRFTKFRDRAYDAGDGARDLGAGAKEAAVGLTQQTAATTAGGTAAAAAAPPQAALARSVGALGAAAAGAVTPQQQMAAATAQVGVAAFDTFRSVDQLKVAYGNAIDAAKTAATTAKLAAEARKTEIETLKDVAALTGNEVLIKRTAVDAANQLAVAVGQQAAAEQKQLDLARQYRAALEQRLTAEGKLTEAALKDLARRDDNLAKQAQEVQKTIEQAEALERQALQARLSAEAMADNADRQGEFAARAAESADALERSRVALADGTISLKEFRDVAARAAFDQGLLNDAIADGTKRIETNSRIQTADTNVRVAGLKIKLEELRNVEAKARADGDETLAARAKIDVKKAELEITRLNNEAKLLEARASVEALQNILREADAGRLQLTPEKRAEYETRLLNAEAKELEAEAAVVSERRDEAEIERLKRLRLAIKDVADQRAAAAAQFSNAGKPAAGIVNQQADPRDENGRTAAQRDALSKQGGPVDNSYVFGLQDRLRRGESFSPDEIPAIQAALKAAETNARLTTGSSVQGLNGQRGATADVIALRQVLARAQGSALGSSGGATGAGSLGVGTAQRDLTANQNAGTTGLSAQEANRVAAENARAAASPAPAATSGGRTVGLTAQEANLRAAENARAAAENAATSAAANQNAGTVGLTAQEANLRAAENARAAAENAATSGGRTVNINLAGLGSTSVRVASDADAAKVEALLRQIEQAASRSGG